MPAPDVQGAAGELAPAADALARSSAPASPSIGLRFAMSLLLFGLFAEWLYPLDSLLSQGQTQLITLLFALTGLLLLFGCFRLPAALFAVLPPLLIAFSLLYLYGRAEGLSWFTGYARLFGADLAGFLETGRLSGVSMETRALLLLIGWTLLVVSVQMLALGRQSILLFLSVTVVYLLALETGAGLELYLAVIRSAALGLILQAIAFNKAESGSNRGTGAVAGTGIVLVCVAGAALLSSLLPLQPVRAIPWQQVAQKVLDWSGVETHGEPGSAAAFSVSGYSRDDTKLGAPLRLRHDPYFTALSPYNTYWRGESKSVYTGRGWIQPAAPETAAEGERPAGAAALPGTAGAEGMPNGSQPDSGLAAGADMPAVSGAVSGAAADQADTKTDSGGKELIRQTVMFKEPLTGKVALLSGGLPVEPERIIAGDRTNPVQVNPRYDALADALVIDYAVPSEQIFGYVLTSEAQTVPGTSLRNDQGPDPEEVAERFLQLPDSLPDRVRKLGERLVADESNRYDAAKAVEAYLKYRYAYSLDSRIPPEGADFVDRFLFVDQIGYCDHFSTAMVVLLRSGGIPTRWVKGFAPGEPARSAADGSGNAAADSIAALGELALDGAEVAAMQRYTVTYADAHSWVEVYFPAAGWVPFDPTPGFGEAIAAGSGERPEGKSGAGIAAVFPVLAKAGEVAKLLVPKLIAMASAWWPKMKPAPGPFVWTAWVLAAGFAVLVCRELALSGHLIRLWLQPLWPRRSFPERGELLSAADRVWRELSLAYGPKLPALTAREYLAAALRGQPGLAEPAEEFVRIWEVLYYGGPRPDRKESMDFLKHCRNLALRRR